MKRSVTISVCATLTFIGAFSQMRAEKVNLKTHASPHPNIRIERLARKVENTPFQALATRPLYDASYTIRNQDRREVVAICALWTLTDQNGKVTTSRMKMDTFLATVKTVVIDAGGTLDVSPAGWLAELPKTTEQDELRPVLRRRLASLNAAQQVDFEVDSIIFEDGELWGTNACQLDQEITARKMAAIHLAMILREALAEQKDVRPILESISHAPVNPKKELQAKWESRFAGQMLAEGRDIEPYVRYLEKLPAPPHITAKN